MKARDDIAVEDHERAFELDTGELVAVGITRKEMSAEDAAVALKVQARLIGEDGATVSINGMDAVAPAKVRTVMAAALADGTRTIAGEMADATTDAVVRAREYAAALEAWAYLPEG